MKRLNLKLIAFLCIGAVLCVVGVVVANRFQMGRMTRSLKQDAEEELAAGNEKDALMHYVKYLQQTDDVVDVYIATAKLAKDTPESMRTPKFIKETYQALNKGVRKYGDNVELRQLYADFLLSLKYRDLATETSEHLEWITEQPAHDAQWDVKLMTVYTQLAKYDKAIERAALLIGFDLKTSKFDFEKAKTPKEISPYIILARLLRERAEPSRPKDADEVMDQLVNANEKSYQAHLERARYLMQYKSPTDGEKDIKYARELAPDAVEPILAAAETALLKRDYKEATPLLEKGLKLFPKNVAMYRLWAMLHIDQNQPALARPALNEAVKLQPKELDLHWILLEVELQQKDLPAARESIKTLEKLNFPSTLVELMQARLAFNEGKWLQASQTFERLRPLLANSPEHTKQCDLFAAQCYEQLGQFDKQLDACNRVLSIDPTNLAAQVGVASAQMGSGKRDAARKSYEALAARLGKDKALDTPQVWVPLIELRLEEESKKPADERDWSKVETIVKALEHSPSAKPLSIALVKSEVLMRKDDLAGARKTLEDAKPAGAEDVSYWSALATVVMAQKERENGPAGALKILDSAPAAIRGSVALRLNRAGILLRQGADDVKAQLAKLDEGSDKLSEAERVRLWSGLGAALLSIGDREGAEKYWMRVADLSPDDVRIRFGLLDLARDPGDDVVMARVQKDIARIEGPTSPEARFVEAARKVALVRQDLKSRTPAGRQPPPLSDDNHKSLATARKLMEEVKQVRGSWHEAERVLGEIELLDGNGDVAIAHYQQALKLGPPNPVTVRALAHLLSQRGRTKEIQEVLAMVGPSNIAGYGLEQVNVENLLAQGDVDAAVKEAKALAPDDSTDPYRHLWLANVYERAKRPDDAETSLRRAVTMGNELPETWLLLIDHLVNNKKSAEAERLLLEARKKLPEDRINQVLGPGYEATGQMAAAEEYYKLAIKQAPDDLANHRLIAMFYSRTGRKDEAKAEVINVLRGAQDKPEQKANLVWGRRALADLLAATGEYSDFQKAKALLIENVKLDEENQDDKIRLATLLAARNDEPTSWREAAQWLEKLRPPLARREQMTLARLHDVTGEWNKARGEMFSLVSQSKPEKELYAMFVEMLIRHHELADAKNWLERLDSAQPFAGWYLRARILVKEGHPADAIALLKRVIPPRPIPADKVNLLRTVALLTDQLGLLDAAEEMYREFATYDTETGTMQLAAFLARVGKIDEALDLCETALKTQPAPAVMQLCCTALRAQPRKIQPEQIQRVEKWFQQSLAKDADSVPLGVQYADFLDIAGRPADAEKEMRKLLARSDVKFSQRAILLNNLAFSLANQKKDLPEALEMVNKAAQLIGFSSDVMDTRGTVHVAMENFKAAVSDYQQAVMLPEPSPLKLLHLACAQNLAADRTAARETLQQAKDAQLDTNSLTKAEMESYERLVRDVGI